MYTDKVMDHFTNPRNVGEIEDASGVGEVGNASCGDIMKIFLKVEDNVIKDVKFKTFGCGAAIATAQQPGGCGSSRRPAGAEDALFEPGGRCLA
jgi:NifU-like protein involved in Fe-S cluster formation